MVAAECERCYSADLGGAFGVEGVGTPQHRRRRRRADCRGVTGFGAGDQDAFDGPIPRITDLEGASTRRVQTRVAVAVVLGFVPQLLFNAF